MKRDVKMIFDPVTKDLVEVIMPFMSKTEVMTLIGLGVLPAYWICWRQPVVDERGRIETALTTILAFIVWWSFLVGHVVNDIRGFGS